MAALRRGSSAHWFSRTATVEELRNYLWGVMRLRHDNTRHSKDGFAYTNAGTVEFVAARSRQGVIISCFALNEIGIQRINDAMSDERAAMTAQLQRGTYAGNPVGAWCVVTENGIDTEGSEVFDFINGSTISSLDKGFSAQYI
ncbi:hypothetical protein V3N99_08060 [Dermatophilaceae bacterium Soc4.6]